MELTITMENFEEEVLKSPVPVLVDFWATWCGPCKMIAPHIEKLSEDFAGNIKVCKVNIDEQFPLAAAYKVNSIPTLLYFKNGEVSRTLIGYHTKEEIEQELNL